MFIEIIYLPLCLTLLRISIHLMKHALLFSFPQVMHSTTTLKTCSLAKPEGHQERVE